MHNTLLARNFDVSRLRKALNNQNRPEIVNLVRARFEERYFKPIKSIPREQRNAFTTMAVACLVIEAFQSFVEGRGDTRSHSRAMFVHFFQENPDFTLDALADDFFENVRCGILHCAETRNGWKLIRNGKLFDQKSKSINATRFMRKIEEKVDAYCQRASIETWNSGMWRNLQTKCKALIRSTLTK